MSSLPENLRKFFKQVQRLYERDSDFQAGLDNIIENGQVFKISWYLLAVFKYLQAFNFVLD